MNLPEHFADDMALPRPSGKARVSLTLAKFSFLCGPLTGIPAIVLGILGLRDAWHGRSADRFRAALGIGLGTVGGLLLPFLILFGVSHARDSAARTRTANNLKNIGMALHDYHDTNSVIPPPVSYYQFQEGAESHGTVCELCSQGHHGREAAPETESGAERGSPTLRVLPYSWRVAIGPYLDLG
jgi:hypothetical protein